MKLLLIANCQIQYLEWRLRAQPFISEVPTIPIHFFQNPGFQEEHQPKLDKAISDTWHILTYPIGDKFDWLCTDHIRERSLRVHSMTNLIFKGLHPDICYLGSMGRRVQGPLGDAHSKLIISAYLNGYSTNECVELFSPNTFARLEYFSEWYLSALELLKRERRVDLKFANRMLVHIRERPSFFTDNHPTSFLLEHYVKYICKSLGQDTRFISQPQEFLPNFLSDSLIWPVYPQLCEWHGLAYAGNMVFRQPLYLGGKTFGLEEIIEMFYSSYNSAQVSLDDPFWSSYHYFDSTMLKEV